MLQFLQDVIYMGTATPATGGGGGGEAVWGGITGTLSNQTDLKNALDAKQDTVEEYTANEVETLWESINV